MKKLILFFVAVRTLSSCVSFKSCPAYAVLYKNETTGRYHVQDTNEMVAPTDTFKVIPSMHRIRIIDVKLN